MKYLIDFKETPGGLFKLVDEIDDQSNVDIDERTDGNNGGRIIWALKDGLGLNNDMFVTGVGLR